MPSRARDWLRQAEHDLGAARNMRSAGRFDWACFAAHQAAEKALKALYQHHHAEGWGHALHRLVGELVSDEPGLARLLDGAKALDKHYIPSRYPNGFEAGAPVDVYTPAEADQAIQHAESIVGYCSSRCSGA